MSMFIVYLMKSTEVLTLSAHLLCLQILSNEQEVFKSIIYKAVERLYYRVHMLESLS